MYTSMKVTVFDDQHDKLNNAIAHQMPISIKVDLDHSGGGEHTLLLTRGQIAKIERSRLIEKRKVTIHLSKRQVQANLQLQGFSRYAGRISRKSSSIDTRRTRDRAGVRSC